MIASLTIVFAIYRKIVSFARIHLYLESTVKVFARMHFIFESTVKLFHLQEFILFSHLL